MKNLKIKKLFPLLAITVVLSGGVIPTISASASTQQNVEDNVGGFSDPNNWKYWMTSGPYTIFRNSVTGDYRMIQTQGTFEYMAYVIANGWGQSWHP
ncbi:type VII secretion protein EssB, essB [Lactococcus cremoris]|nr:type VII secretion protein EssB, essB [Lactococcus cremoris]MDN5471399.1 hypothetical protein [Lactococcus lactis]KKW74375.1 type VII secretion protein EssB, essB [Lactococcus cremoris]MDN5488708.1 hypothetical protein [Lactococcus lactis]MDN5577406.1 hypothetical protein [Lactococcus lactis]